MNKVTKVTGGGGVSQTAVAGEDAQRGDRDRGGKNHIGSSNMRDKDGCMGATACLVVPGFWDAHQQPGDWQILARWIDDNLPYSSLFFFPTLWAVNINWHERPLRRVDSYAEPKGRWCRNDKGPCVGA